MHAVSAANVAAAITITLGIIALFGGLYRVVRRIEQSIGQDNHGRTLNQRMDRVEHQLWPNGGSSLADRVERQGLVLTETAAEVRVTRDLLTKIIEKPSA